ncbi:hypothetical protein DL991_10755 [Amycolatopsis sp. WAC 01375]|uniref:hypothetical protein n=1 Tax=Amycolatopsis sp. WAC 01375 TaxID=2203194 RepID=UPI000F78D8D1|nr:hypothetical protein [Amycolatopsis sp. WAC 01375]RSM80582.1 hypothetical protein DL991_10755 [Amycolatopsis sp. WAC 01375]
MNVQCSLVPLLAAAAATLTACSGDPPSPHPVPTAGWVTLAPPEQPGPRIVIEGTVTWRTDHVGCAEMVTDHGQTLRLVGDVATGHERAVFEGGPAQEYARVTGYTINPHASATVCGSGIPFVAERVEPNQRR